MCPNSCSTGFNQGEYWALNRTFTFILRAVSSTSECLWMTALSMNSKIVFFYSFLSVLMLRRVWYMKFSNSIESTAPSMIYVETTFVWLIAASKDTEYCYLLFTTLAIESSLALTPYFPSFSASNYWLSWMVLYFASLSCWSTYLDSRFASSDDIFMLISLLLAIVVIKSNL